MQYHSLSQNTALNESSTVTDVSALEYFPLLVNILLLFNRIIVNVFNFVIIIYESRSTSFSMKRKSQLNCFELKKKRKKKGMCLCVVIFLPNIKQSQEKKTCLHCSVLWGIRILYSFVQTVKLHLFTGTAEEQLRQRWLMCIYCLLMSILCLVWNDV